MSLEKEPSYTVTVDGIDACYDIEVPGVAPVITVIENEEDWLEYMAEDLGLEKLVGGQRLTELYGYGSNYG